SELLSHPQLAANELVVEGTHPHAGPMRQPRHAARFDATPAELRLPAPLLGEHTDEVLAELGLDAEQVTTLRRDGILD
ncbi:MAG: CoA transferase, partial [Myxococcota bacterium]|nr:CoA transferase [Myxococcota bacterium]